MAETSIEWTDVTWNPVSGCTRVSAGCDRCYAVTMTHRLEAMGKAKYAGLTVLNPKGDRHFNGQVRTHADALSIPLGWKKPRRIFVNSMSDLFHRDVPFEFIDRVFAVMALCPQHTFQVLTKRPERMAEYQYRTRMRPNGRVSTVAEILELLGESAPTMEFKDQDGGFADITPGEHLRNEADAERITWPLPNVWLGTSVEDQKSADERIPELLKCPAAVRFLSCEPLLGAVDLRRIANGVFTVDALNGVYWKRPRGEVDIGEDEPDGITGQSIIDWVIVGGESGPGARPCDLLWINSIRKQCESAHVSCFIKQLGSVPENSDPSLRCGGIKSPKGGDLAEWPMDLRVREFPKSEPTGKGSAVSQ